MHIGARFPRPVRRPGPSRSCRRRPTRTAFRPTRPRSHRERGRGVTPTRLGLRVHHRAGGLPGAGGERRHAQRRLRRAVEVGNRVAQLQRHGNGELGSSGTNLVDGATLPSAGSSALDRDLHAVTQRAGGDGHRHSSVGGRHLPSAGGDDHGGRLHLLRRGVRSPPTRSSRRTRKDPASDTNGPPIFASKNKSVNRPTS